MANVEQRVAAALRQGNGVLHLAPTWVPRAFAVPGARIGLARQDQYAYGIARGGIDERWLASTTQPDNGPNMVPNEGLSEVVTQEGERFLLKEAIQAVGAELIGARLFDDWGRWPTLGKLFDNVGPLPFHLHPTTEVAALTGQVHKPEAYYFPPQYNQINHTCFHTYFGLEPGTTKADVKECLKNWNKGDNNVLDLSKAYRITPGTGWMSPAGLLHAPASAVTYEIQWGTDTFAMFQSVLEDGTIVPWDLVVKNVPDDKKHDLDFIVEMIDWDANTVTNFKQTYFRAPKTDRGSIAVDGYEDRWIVYGTANGRDVFSAKELTLAPGAGVTLRDNEPAGVLVVQGSGTLGEWSVEGRNYIRFGECTHDEFFITIEAATRGVTVQNTGLCPLVMLRHFGPDSQSA